MHQEFTRVIQDMSQVVRNATNRAVLRYAETLSAHDDVVNALCKAVEPLGDVQTFCPDPKNFRYVLAATNSIVFGLAAGMHLIGFRVGTSYVDRAVATGGGRLAEVGPEWASFDPFRADWPQVDLRFWALKAYVYARHGESGL